ncbi:MAG: U32 family peptidase [Desulfuromonadales bacterium]|nr:U32 family peptidase [Desulfuromonadales bacterium]
MQIPELLAPAGNLEKLVTALDYGADAVYCGLDRFSLRAQAGNLSLVELEQGCALAHERGKKLYLTLNAFLRSHEESACRALLEQLRDFRHDACIVADPGMLSLLRAIDPDRELHLSTQANTGSAAAANFWQSQQVKRLNLARELRLEEIRAIRQGTTAELEVFVHGAMCVAYSGRCLLSSALTGRSANRGNCSHPCRWEYAVQETTRPGEFLAIEEDKSGSYLFNSRDLCLLGELPALLDAGIDSLKIEGRMKSRYYVAIVTRVYRAALDACRNDRQNFTVDPAWQRELDSVSHRPYGTGFLYDDDPAFVHRAESRYHRDCDFVGVVLTVDGDGRGLVEGRNRFLVGEELELLGPQMRTLPLAVRDVRTEAGEPLAKVQPNARVRLPLPAGSRPGDLLRRWR